MAASVTSICNRALLSIGARAQIANLNEPSEEARACNVLFTPTFEALGRSARWNCLHAQTTLSLIAAATGTPENPNGTTLPLPPTPWLYEYQLPASSLAIRFIVPSQPAAATGIPVTSATIAAPIYIPGGGQIPFVVGTALDPNNNVISVVFINQSQAQAVYTLNQSNPALWDSQFQAAMVASLAAYLVPALSLDLALMKISIATANGIIAQARATDGNEGVTVMDHVPDFMRARASGGMALYSAGYGWNGACYGALGDMCWPGY